MDVEYDQLWPLLKISPENYIQVPKTLSKIVVPQPVHRGSICVSVAKFKAWDGDGGKYYSPLHFTEG